MNKKHTPGPWMIKGRVNTSTEAVRIESHHPAPEHHLYQVADVLDANGYPQNEANLMLIAAAPDLLSTASAVLAMCDSIGEFRNGVTDPTGSIDEGAVRAGEILHSLRAAISKATGEGQ